MSLRFVINGQQGVNRTRLNGLGFADKQRRVSSSLSGPEEVDTNACRHFCISNAVVINNN